MASLELKMESVLLYIQFEVSFQKSLMELVVSSCHTQKVKLMFRLQIVI